MSRQEVPHFILTYSIFMLASFGVVMIVSYAASLNVWAVLGLIFCFVVLPGYLTYGYVGQTQERGVRLSASERSRYFGSQSLRLILFVVIFCVTSLLVLASVHFFWFEWGLVLALSSIVVGFIFVIVADAWLNGSPAGAEDDGHERGPRLISQDEAQTKAIEQEQGDALTVPFAGADLPHKFAYTGVMELWTVGAGKSMVLKLLMAVVLALIGKGLSHRAVVFEPKGKGEILPFLHNLPLSCPIHNLNPFLDPAVAVDIIGSIPDPAVAIRVGQVLVPIDPNTKQPYFSRTGGALLGGVLWAVKQRLGEKATFRHVLLIMRYPHRIEQVLDASPHVCHLVAQHLKTAGETVQSVISETAGKTGLLEPIAAALKNAKHTSDLEDWVQYQESILVLGTSHRRRAAMAAYNRVIITLLADIILEGEELAHQHDRPYLRHWFILDEFHALERIEALPELLSQGRSKGVCTVLTLHTKGQMTKVYEEHGASEILSSVNNKLFLRVSDPDTEKLVQDEIGTQDLWESRRSYQYDPVQGKWSWSESEQRETRLLVLGSEASDLPLPSRESGIPGFAKIPEVGRYRVTVPGDVIDAHVPSDNGSVSLWYRDRPSSEYILADLTEEEKLVLQINDRVLEAKNEARQHQSMKVRDIDPNNFNSDSSGSSDTQGKRSAKPSIRR